MDAELALVLGIALAVVSIPSIVSALVDGRAPRAGALVILIAGGLVLYGLSNHPSGIQLSELPETFVRVVGRIIN